MPHEWTVPLLGLGLAAIGTAVAPVAARARSRGWLGIVLALAAAVLWLAAANGSPSGPKLFAQRHPPKEDAYTITSVLQLLQPVNIADMNDDFQDARLLTQDKASITVETTYYPLGQVSIGENPNWQKDYAGMTEYLKPTPTENWDATMRRDLFAELRQDGIEPGKLTDKQLVEEVSRWAMKRAHSTHAFSIWAVHYPEGKPEVYPLLREAFDGQKAEKRWTDQQMFEQEVLGRSMFYNRVHAACTSSSVYMAADASTNASTQFRLLSMTPAEQTSPAPASGAEAPTVLRLSGAQVTYSGINETWARRMGQVVAQARLHALHRLC